MEDLTKSDFSLKSLFIPLTTFRAASILALVGFIGYFNSLFGAFVWDDVSQIAQNTGMHSLAVIPKLFFYSNHTFYRPIFFSCLALLYSLFGQQVFFYHLMQLCIHTANAILVFLLFTKFFEKRLSFLLSLLFLIHPINVEAVAYISAISDPLFVFFGLLALHLMIQDRVSLQTTLVASGLMLLSLLTKETGIIMLFIIVLYNLLFKKRRAVVMILFTALPISVYLLFRFVFAHTFYSGVHHVPIGHASFFERLITIPKIIFFYLSTCFLPLRLAISQHWIVRSMTFSDFWAPLLTDIVFFASLVGISIACYRRNKKVLRLFLFFFWWFLAGLSMYIQIIPLDMTVADRWFYVPLVGLLGMTGVALQQIKIHKQYLRILAITAVAVLITAFAFRTIVRNKDWYSETTLFSHDAQLEDSFDVENIYGTLLGSENNYSQALVHFKKSVALNAYDANLDNVASSYFQLGQWQKTVEYSYMAFRAESSAPPPHLHKEDTYEEIVYMQLLLGNFQEAKRILMLGTQDYPDSASLWYLLAISEYKLKDQHNALIAIERAYALNPNQHLTNIGWKIRDNLPISITTGFTPTGSLGFTIK